MKPGEFEICPYCSSFDIERDEKGKWMCNYCGETWEEGGRTNKKASKKEYKELLRSFWAHVIEENEGNVEKIKKCFKGGRNE